MVAWGADLVHTGQIDPDPTVSAWSQYLETVMTSDKKSLAQMIDDPLWLKRLLSILATDTMGAPRDDIKKLTQDPDPTVAKLAKAALEAKLSSRGATTEPSATQPSTTQPGIGPIPAPTTSPAAPVLPAPVPAAPLAPIVPEAPAPAKPQPATPPLATPAATPAPVTPPPAPTAPPAAAPTPAPAPTPPPTVPPPSPSGTDNIVIPPPPPEK
jgi:hypothetical protein